MKVKCPCLNCAYYVFIDEGYFHHTRGQAFEILKLHLLNNHTIGELEEWLERALVEYFDKKVLEVEKQ